MKLLGKSMKILVLDAAQRSALAVTRSLGGKLPGSVYTAEAAPAALAGFSRYSKDYFQSPNPATQGQAYLGWLSALVKDQGFNLVIPVTEVTSQLILSAEAQQGITIPFADYAKVMQLADKGALVKLAESLGIPVPESQWFANAQQLNIEKIVFPVVLKPCLSKLLDKGVWISTRVKVLADAQAYYDELQQSPYLMQYPFMLQAFIPGCGAGVFALYDKGKPVVFFAHNRLREKPPEGGISVLSESAEITPELKQYAEKLLTAVDWHGVAMVEFRKTPENTYYLMEVNTRFWGSLQLAIDSGVDFPWLLVQGHLGLPYSPPLGYVTGQRLRWWLGDLDSLYLYLRGRHSFGEKFTKILQFLSPTGKKTRYEINRWQDLNPAVFELKLYLRHFFK